MYSLVFRTLKYQYYWRVLSEIKILNKLMNYYLIEKKERKVIGDEQRRVWDFKVIKFGMAPYRTAPQCSHKNTITSSNHIVFIQAQYYNNANTIKIPLVTFHIHTFFFFPDTIIGGNIGVGEYLPMQIIMLCFKTVLVLSEDFIRELMKSMYCCHSIVKIHHWKVCALFPRQIKYSFQQHFFLIKIKVQAKLKVIRQKLYKDAKSQNGGLTAKELIKKQG